MMRWTWRLDRSREGCASLIAVPPVSDRELDREKDYLMTHDAIPAGDYLAPWCDRCGAEHPPCDNEHKAPDSPVSVKSVSAGNTWTFVGHWDDSDRIVVEYVLDGDVEDTREDTGQYEGGLWAASASGRTVGEAQAAAINEYESELHGDEIDNDGNGDGS